MVAIAVLLTALLTRGAIGVGGTARLVAIVIVSVTRIFIVAMVLVAVITAIAGASFAVVVVATRVVGVVVSVLVFGLVVAVARLANARPVLDLALLAHRALRVARARRGKDSSVAGVIELAHARVVIGCAMLATLAVPVSTA